MDNNLRILDGWGWNLFIRPDFLSRFQSASKCLRHLPNYHDQRSDFSLPKTASKNSSPRAVPWRPPARCPRWPRCDWRGSPHRPVYRSKHLQTTNQKLCTGWYIGVDIDRDSIRIVSMTSTYRHIVLMSIQVITCYHILMSGGFHGLNIAETVNHFIFAIRVFLLKWSVSLVERHSSNIKVVRLGALKTTAVSQSGLVLGPSWPCILGSMVISWISCPQSPQSKDSQAQEGLCPLCATGSVSERNDALALSICLHTSVGCDADILTLTSSSISEQSTWSF